MAKFTLFLYVFLALALVTSSNASTFPPHRRDHADVGRLLKKRAPIDILGQDSDAQQSEQAPVASGPVQSTPPASVVPQSTLANPASVQASSAAASSAAASSSSGGGLLGTVGGLLPTESSSASSSAASTASSTSDYLSSAPLTSAQASQTPATTPSQSIVYLTTSASDAPTSTPTNLTSSSSGMSHTAMTVLIVIAACVGASVIVWTIIRKWKFRPSSDFEGRMQPIDWHPGAGAENAGLPGQHRPLSRASSFHSGSSQALGDDQMRGVGEYGATALNPIPDHDFTAGPAQLAPVGGYADLARGPSPQPMMQEPLAQAPSVNRPVQYDQYGVPLHHGYNGY